MVSRLVFPVLLSVALLPACSAKKKAQTLPSVTPAATADRAASAPASGVTVDDNGAAAGGGAFQPIYFEFDSTVLSPTARAELDGLAAHLQARPRATVTIEGHADDRGTVEYNVGLGERRAVAIRDYLVRLGVPAARLGVVSFGEERPADTGGTEAAWARNRRDDFRVTAGADRLVSPR
jgi:peptidoglycan-associated lipoprotein